MQTKLLMFDGVKFSMTDKQTCDRLLNNSKLDFDELTSIATGEIKSYSTDYKGLRIQLFTSGRTQVSGSLHKFSNSGQHNYDDFTFSKLKRALSLIENELEISLLKATINNLEFGVNIITSFYPSALINDLLCYKWHQFDTMNVKGPGLGKECKAFNQYIVKIYNKGLQYARGENILRIEKKVLTMVALKFGKITLADLLDHALWVHCQALLLAMVDDILIVEDFDQTLLKKPEKRIFESVISHRNWKYMGRCKKVRYKDSFNKLIDKHGRQNYRATIKTLMFDKLNCLLKS